MKDSLVNVGRCFPALHNGGGMTKMMQQVNRTEGQSGAKDSLPGRRGAGKDQGSAGASPYRAIGHSRNLNGC
jgi:hypothetical protein